MVHFNPDLQTSHKIAAAISELGYNTNVTATKKPPSGRTSSSQVKRKPKRSTGSLAHTVLSVQGMVCTSCVDNIEGNISEMKGINDIKVSLQEKCARVAFNPKVTNPDAICEAIEELGFDATPTEPKQTLPTLSQVEIKVEGMVCKSCVDNIEGNISEKKGVKEIKVSLKEKLARVTYDVALTNPRQISEDIEDMGFDAVPLVAGAAPAIDAITKVNTVGTVGIDGMFCHSCVSLIESGVGELDGVVSVRVSLEKKMARIVYDSSKVNMEVFKSTIEDVGFLVTTTESERWKSGRE